MTERTIDAERAGGTDATPRSLAVPEMSIDEALEYHAKFAGRMVPTKSDQARGALVAEIVRLKTINDTLMTEDETRDLMAEVERLKHELTVPTKEHAVTRPVLAINLDDLIFRLRSHVRDRGAPHLSNGAWALMLEAAGQMGTLKAEVEQLRLQQENLQKICRIENSEVRRLIDEIDRFSSALPGIIGCENGDPTACTNDPPGYWAPCCRVRRRCVASGLLPAVEKTAEAEDGA